MLLPKKVKFRKWHTMRKDMEALRPDTRGITLSFGSYGLKAETSARMTSNQIEAARKAMSRALGKTGRIWIRIFPDRPFTRKAAEVPMGSGKGEPAGFCFETYAGRMLFEVDGVSEVIAKEAFRKANSKLPVKTKMVSR